ncbi:MAG: 5'-nucleotidase, lipoprotein e(P4) family [Bacteroidetes bacterium]|nr:5'-nucleotidase, lipoprotein e(P4) family [Bacteroidota bacterium]
MRFISKSIIIAFSFFALYACVNQNCDVKNTPKETTFNNDHLLMAVLYQQQAAECKALYYQAFNLAQLMLDKDLADKTQKGKRAVVVDIDETILDNSPFEAKMITKNAKYPEDWNVWTSMAKAKACSGAADFLNYAAGKGVEVFYITNRNEKEADATIKNLKEEHFPMVDTIHLLLKAKESSKEMRRLKIMKKYHIALLVGDNLTDFAADFDKTSSEVRDAKVTELRKEFGKRFIVLPNAMYGDWERAMYDAYKADTTKTKTAIRKMLLKDF